MYKYFIDKSSLVILLQLQRKQTIMTTMQVISDDLIGSMAESNAVITVYMALSIAEAMGLARRTVTFIGSF